MRIRLIALCLLMSAALSQKMPGEAGFARRLMTGFFITDEIFGLGIAWPGMISCIYLGTAFVLADVMWATGTLCGILVGNVLPPDVVKIDRSFVSSIEKNDTDRYLVRNIVDLASVFRSKVCVEGIETVSMRDILRGIHVHSFQGYYYAKPLPLEQCLVWKKHEGDHQAN